jgi:hypothetical protein
LPDGIFSNQKSRFGFISEEFAMKDIGILYGHLVYFIASWYILRQLVYFMVIWYILCLFGTFYGYLVYCRDIWYCLWLFGIFPPVLLCCTKRKIWQPWSRNTSTCEKKKRQFSRKFHFIITEHQLRLEQQVLDAWCHFSKLCL